MINLDIYYPLHRLTITEKHPVYVSRIVNSLPQLKIFCTLQTFCTEY